MSHPGLDGIQLCESEICLIDPESSLCALRGERIERLAEERDYDEVACLLLRGHLPGADELAEFRAEIRRGREIGAQAALALARCGWPSGAHPMDVLRGLVSLAAIVSPGLAERPPRQQAELLIGVVGEAAARVCRAAAGHDPGEPQLAPGASLPAWLLATVLAAEPAPADVAALGQVAVLHAEHELNASTFAVRVVASTLADLTAAVGAGIAALKGPLHGGANEAALRALEQIGGPQQVDAWVEARLAAGERIMGFGHRVYRRDPREDILRRLGRERTAAIGRPELYETAARLETCLSRRKNLHANPDLYSGMIYEAVGLPGACATVVFAAARTAGWCAHGVEQLEHNRLIRPRAVYVGPPVAGGGAGAP